MQRRVVVIRNAHPDEAEVLTDLALRSKAVWGYDAAFMAACVAELTVRPECLSAEIARVAEVTGRCAGFYRLRPEGTRAEVEACFVEPGELRRGIGRRLWADLEGRAEAAGIRRIDLDADPHAEPFYAAMGMAVIGRSPSRSIPGRTLARMAKCIGSVDHSLDTECAETPRAGPQSATRRAGSLPIGASPGLRHAK